MGDGDWGRGTCPDSVPGSCPWKDFQRWPDQALAAFPTLGTIQERDSGHKSKELKGLKKGSHTTLPGKKLVSRSVFSVSSRSSFVVTNALGFGQFHGAQQGKVSKSAKSPKGNKGINFVNTQAAHPV